MRADPETYRNVAENCSQYSPKNDKDSFTSSSSECSCTTCGHFAKGAYCDIDLYDPIVNSHNFK